MKETKEIKGVDAPGGGRWVGRRRWLVAGGLGLAGLGIVVAAGLPVGSGVGEAGSGGGVAAVGRALPVVTVPVVGEEAYGREVRFIGRVESARRSEVGFELAGTLVRVGADDGDRVEEGQVLAWLDTARLEAERDELRAALAQAEAGSRLAASTLERIGRAVEGGGVSRQRFDEAARERERSEAATARIRAQLDAVEVGFEKSEVRSPFDGVVVERYVDDGSVLSPGVPVLRLLETGRLEARVGVAPWALDGLRVGGAVELSTRGGHGVAGEVARVVPERRRGTRTVDVVVEIAAGGTVLHDGDLVELAVAQSVAEPGSWLPRAALTGAARGMWAVYVAEPERPGGGRGYVASRRHVEVLHQAGDDVFVRGALEEGDLVVADGMHRIVPGQRLAVDAGAPRLAGRPG